MVAPCKEGGGGHVSWREGVVMYHGGVTVLPFKQQQHTFLLKNLIILFRILIVLYQSACFLSSFPALFF